MRHSGPRLWILPIEWAIPPTMVTRLDTCYPPDPRRTHGLNVDAAEDKDNDSDNDLGDNITPVIGEVEQE